MTPRRLRLGDMLVAAKLVTEAQVGEALAAQKELGLRLGETLVTLGYVNERQMTQVLSNQLTLPWVDLLHVDFSRELLDLVPAELAERFELVPVYVRSVRRQGDTLYVAMADPLHADALSAVSEACGLPVKAMVASPTPIRDAIRVYYLGLPPAGEEAPEEHTWVVEDEAAAPAPEPAEPEPAESEPTEPESDDAEPDDAEPDDAEPPLDALAAPRSRAEPAPRAEIETLAPAPRSRSLPPSRDDAGTFVTLTLLDGSTVRLPKGGAKGSAAPVEKEKARGLTTRDLIHALSARAAGEDVREVLGDEDLSALLAALLSLLLRKGLVADWEFVTEWKKHREKGGA